MTESKVRSNEHSSLCGFHVAFVKWIRWTSLEINTRMKITEIGGAEEGFKRTVRLIVAIM